MTNNDKKMIEALKEYVIGIGGEKTENIEYVEPLNMNAEYKKAIDSMIRDSKKKRIVVYLNGIPAVMVGEKNDKKRRSNKENSKRHNILL